MRLHQVGWYPEHHLRKTLIFPSIRRSAAQSVAGDGLTTGRNTYARSRIFKPAGRAYDGHIFSQTL